MAEIGCRYFSGYKPCGRSAQCDSGCSHRDLPQISILVIHLGALGAVLRSTALLPAIKRKYPSSKITWVTDKPANHLLLNNSYIDQVLCSDLDGILQLKTQQFEIGFCIDKSLKALGLLRSTTVDQLFGFDVDAKSGSIIPATEHARELWEIGISDELKFHVNQKTENQLVHEALNLGSYIKDEYQLFFSEEEAQAVVAKRQIWQRRSERLIGLNTGCSPQGIPYKKLSIDFHRVLISEINRLKLGTVVLLGGPEDSERNVEIGEDLQVIQSATNLGLRDGLTSVAACDVVVTGDSLGMHMAIALKKATVAWFGPTCAHEIELYGRGQKIMSSAPCGPCWKRHCQKTPMCYDLVSLVELTTAIKESPIAVQDPADSNRLYW